MYQASAENWGDSRFIANTRHSSFVIDTQGKGANPVDTLLTALCSCMGHYVRDHFVAKGSPLLAFRVAAESNAAREDSKISAISVRIEVGPIRLSPQEQAELLARVETCRIYGTLRQACRIDVTVHGLSRADVAGGVRKYVRPRKAAVGCILGIAFSSVS